MAAIKAGPISESFIFRDAGGVVSTTRESSISATLTPIVTSAICDLNFVLDSIILKMRMIININLSDIPYLFDRSLACGVWQGAFCFTYFSPSFPNGRIWCLIIISHFFKLSLTLLLGQFCYFSNFFLDLRYNNFNICNLSLVFTCAVT